MMVDKNTKMKISINLNVKENFHCWKRFSIVLVKLKSGMFLFDLSERLDISVSLISTSFTTWIKF